MDKKIFRTDIEGLRAVAILLVIAAHFSLPGMAAGFIGVDIFFVISGYLITSILVREHNNQGRIEFVRFYANRFRRLFPALITMIIVSAVAAHYWLPPTQNLTQAEAGAAATFWVSNIYFTFADSNYFAAESTSNLFLHTWSLGVEEQFYLIWPVLISLILVKKNWKLAISAFIIICVASFALNIILSISHPIFAYYMMPTRAWQFSIGALAWFVFQNYEANTKQTNILSSVAVALLVVSLIVIDKHSTYPGWLAILPTASAALILISGKQKQGLIHTLLSNPAMQWIGGLSYSWYLWHWPALVIGTYLLPLEGNITNTIFVIAISLLLAIFTHKIIENPIRFGKTKKLDPEWQVGGTLVLMMLFSWQLVNWHGETEQLIQNSQQDKYIKASRDLAIIYQHGCDEWYANAEVKPCTYGKPDAEKTAVLFGDSVGAQWFSAIEKILNPEEWKLIVLTKSACPIVDEAIFYQRINREYTECSQWRNDAISWLQEQKIDWLFIGSTASYDFTDQQWQNGTQRILDKLKTTAENIFIIEANPTLGFSGPECLMKNPAKCGQGTADNSKYNHVAGLLKEVISNNSNTYWITTSEMVCPAGNCQAERGELVVYRDAQHLTARFVAATAENISQQIQQAGQRK